MIRGGREHQHQEKAASTTKRQPETQHHLLSAGCPGSILKGLGV